MSFVICILLFICLVYLWMQIATKDKDFIVNDELLTFTKNDKVTIIAYIFLAIIIFTKLSTVSMIFATVSLPYLIIAAITDKKTKLVYDMPFYVFGVVAIILETYMYKEFHCSVLWLFLFIQIFASLKLFGKGDRAMSVVCGVIYFIYNPVAGIIEALLVTCIMILVAEIIFYIRAIKEHNLDGPFKLKESRPLGPDLCLATFIILTGVSLL